MDTCHHKLHFLHIVSTSPEASLVLSKFVAGPTMEGPCWLPDDVALVNADGQPVPKSTLDQTDIVGVSIRDSCQCVCNLKIIPLALLLC